MIVTNSGEGGKLPSVEDRGQELNGSSYPSLGNEPHAPGATRRFPSATWDTCVYVKLSGPSAIYDSALGIAEKAFQSWDIMPSCLAHETGPSSAARRDSSPLRVILC